MKVNLDWQEVAHAARVGVHRQVVNLAQQNHDSHRFKGDPFDIHIRGAIAEYAFAKATGQFWQPVSGDFKALAGDVGDDQVRSTTRPNGSLILHPSDSDTARFWLVIDQCPDYEVVGWIFGRDGKREGFWRTDTGRPCFMVPQGSLYAPAKAGDPILGMAA